MIINLLMKKLRGKKKSSAMDHKVITTDYFRVIEPSEIEYNSKIPDFGVPGRPSEEEYKDYLKSVQYLIEEYQNTGAICSFDNIKKYSEQEKLNKFKCCFLDGDCIAVEKTLSGKYRVLFNGYHRMYVARKYGLKLLVHVCQEVE